MCVFGWEADGAPHCTSPEGTGRITTREVWKLIDSLKDIINHQITLIESTKSELEEVKHDQNVLCEQNKKLYEEAEPCKHRLKRARRRP